MTVKDVFELRKQGKIEEAYEAIRPMYAVHQGKYTTLCMFWTASDILKKRIEEKRVQEAENIFRALLRVQPNIDDKDGKAQTAMMHHALRLLTRAFHEIQVQMYGDFMTKKAPSSHDEVVASCLKVMPLLQEAMRRNPRAAYELQKCVATRRALGYHITRDMEQMLSQLNGVQPATDAQQRDFYRRMTEKYPV